MVALRPVAVAVVRAAYATRVVGPAYDALRPAERRGLADEDPDSFFNVVRSAIDYGDDPVPVDLLDLNAAAVTRLLSSDRYQLHAPDLFVYRLAVEGHVQTAVVGDLPLTDHRLGLIRPHELTREAKEAELARHLTHVGVQSSPVGLGYRRAPAVTDVVRAIAGRREPLVDFVTRDGAHQQVWAVEDDALQRRLRAAFDEVDTTYILDGHHRVAAAARVHPEGTFLAALIPDDELHLLPYHRLVHGPLDRPVADLARRRIPGYDTVAVAGPPALGPGQFGLYGDGRWFRLDRRAPMGDLIPAAVADRELLGPLFGIVDARIDPRLDFVPGGAVGQRLVALVDERGGAALTLPAPTVDQIFAEVDAGRVLPPKSTWFEPKLRSGIFLARR